MASLRTIQRYEILHASRAPSFTSPTTPTARHRSRSGCAATCSFVGRKENVFFAGPSGVGKSHLAQALGHEAARRGHDVLFRRTATLLQWISAARGDGSSERRLRAVSTQPLLILDDFGLTPYSEEQQADLYELICERYEKSSTVVTSNRDFSEWLAVFSNPLMGSAAMDRLVHRGIKIVIKGKSYRVDSFLQRSRTLTEGAKAG